MRRFPEQSDLAIVLLVQLSAEEPAEEQIGEKPWLSRYSAFSIRNHGDLPQSSERYSDDVHNLQYIIRSC